PIDPATTAGVTDAGCTMSVWNRFTSSPGPRPGPGAASEHPGAARGGARRPVGSLARMTDPGPALDWLPDSDPAMRWPAMRDLRGAPEDEWRAERARVETDGWGERLLSYEDEDGQWAGGAFIPKDFDPAEWREVGQPWTATAFTLSQLRELGLDPA